MNQISDKEILEKLKELLSDENYGYATTVATYAEAQSLEFNYIAMAEFRDALTHIKIALYSTGEKIISEELTSAFEHIRRAAVEGMQEYVEVRYLKIRKIIYMSRLLPLIISGRKLNKKDVINSEKIIKESIFKGRELKPRKEWQKAIGYFKRAEDEMDKLEEMLPTQEEINNRYSQTIEMIIFIIIGIFIGHYLI